MNDFEQNSGDLYETLDELLAEADCEINASEFQGILAGMISAGLKSTDKGWQSVIIEVVNDGHALSKEVLEATQKYLCRKPKCLYAAGYVGPAIITR